MARRQEQGIDRPTVNVTISAENSPARYYPRRRNRWGKSGFY